MFLWLESSDQTISHNKLWVLLKQIKKLCEFTICRFVGGTLWMCFCFSADAAVCWGNGESGNLGGGGHARGPLLPCRHSNWRGSVSQVMWCGICDFRHLGTSQILPLGNKSVFRLTLMVLSSNVVNLYVEKQKNLLWTAEVNPVLPFTIKTTGTSEKEWNDCCYIFTLWEHNPLYSWRWMFPKADLSYPPCAGSWCFNF